ncbi:Gfo/Idh/MocA family protein [Planctomicrobium piriforme]|nr:Gfo/Idh/MocA family oxidoreductase [Planctomicrobium piriforme]
MSLKHGESQRVDAGMDRRQFLFAAGAMAAWAATPVLAGEKRWRVGVIGHTGRGNYGHGLDTMWLALPETEVVGFADADAMGREKEKARLPGVPAFADYREMLSKLKPDIVAIGPRDVSEHRDMILAAIEAGAKGIYCEKPFCRTLAEADEIVAACGKHDVRLALAHRNRYHPSLPVVKAAVAEGAIGELLEIRCRGKEDQRGGGLDLWVLGCHDFDLARYFAGNALACSAVLEQGSRPALPADVVAGAEGVGPLAGDRVHARFDMENGVPMYFDSIRNAGVKEANFGVQLIGNKGLIDLRIDVEPLAHFVPGNPFQPTSQPRPWVPISSAGIGKPEPIANLKTEVGNHLTAGRDLLASITEGRAPLCSAQDGQAIIEMISAVFASHVQKGARVTLPLTDRSHPLANWT